MTTLDRVNFVGPIPLHGRLIRELRRDQRMARSDGTLGPEWELHLHAEWSCVVVQDGDNVVLVPLHHVGSMVLAPPNAGLGPVAGPLPEPPSPRPGRARTKRLGLVRE